MKLTIPFNSARLGGCRGMTLVELMIAVGVGALVLATTLGLFLFGARSLNAMGNYTQMDSQSRQCLDLMLREIRQATQVVSYQNSGPTQWLTVIRTNPLPVVTNTFTWQADTGSLLWDKTGCPTRSLLLGCNEWSFNFYTRVPGSNYVFATASSVATCKLIDMSWKCSRTNVFTRLNTENVVTAQVVMRNKK